MKTFGNIIWHFPFLGFLQSLVYVIIGTFWCITIVGIPIGLGLFQLSLFTLAPFSQKLVSRKDLELINGKKQENVIKWWFLIVRILYFPCGLILAICSIFIIAAQFISIIGIPCGIVEAKALATIFNPVNKKCVPIAIAEEIERRKANKVINNYENPVPPAQVATPTPSDNTVQPETSKQQTNQEQAQTNNIQPVKDAGSTSSTFGSANTPESSNRNHLLLGGIAAGVLILAGLIAGYCLWYVPYAKDRDALRTYVIANNLILRSSKVAGVEYNILTQVSYGAELITYSKDDEWAEIKSDGVTGFVASAYLLEWDDFKLLNDVWGNTDAKEYIESTKCRLAILDYCKRNQLQTGSNDWQIYTLQKNVQPNNVSFPRLENGYDKFTEFAFIIKNNSTQERKLAIYSFDVENEAPIFLWDEIAPPNGMIRNITCNEDTYYVIYTGDQIRSISWETRARNNMDRISPPPMPAPIVAETLTIVDNEVELAIVDNEVELAETDETEAESIKPEKAEQPSDNATNDNTVYDVVEVNPRFPGGETALRSFLSTHIIYPKVCQEQGIQGRVYVQFVVRKDGNISDVKVLRSPDPYLSKEAERVVNLMPKWEPGKQKGKAVSVKYTLPINFMLQ